MEKRGGNFVTQKKKKTTQNVAYVVLSMLILLLIYIVYQCIILFQKPTLSTLVKQGRLTNYEEVVAYIIRDEELIDTSQYDGERQIVIPDANRVGKGSTIVTYLTEDVTELESKIADLDQEIQTLMETQQSIYSPDVKNLEMQIQDSIYSVLAQKNNIYDVLQVKKQITGYLEKKANIVGERSPTGSRLNALIEERMKYENQVNDSKKELKAEKTGLISYRVDGYESILTPNSFSKLTIEDLKKMKISVNQQIPMDDTQIKIMDNFYCYLAIPMKSEESKKVQLNDTIRISLNGNLSDYELATVEYITEEEGERLIIVKITDNIEALVPFRKVSVNVIWWNYEGLKVTNDTIYETSILEETTGKELAKVKAVNVQKAGYTQEVWIKVEKTVDNFSIIENYEDEELLTLGIPEEMVEGRKKISLYDEVIIQEE